MEMIRTCVIFLRFEASYEKTYHVHDIIDYSEVYGNRRTKNNQKGDWIPADLDTFNQVNTFECKFLIFYVFRTQNCFD